LFDEGDNCRNVGYYLQIDTADGQDGPGRDFPHPSRPAGPGAHPAFCRMGTGS